MDPNDPGRTPGEASAPPTWGQPPAADQSGFGAPPAAPFGAAPQAWGAPAPATSAPSGIRKRILIAVGAVVVVIVALAIWFVWIPFVLNSSHAGKVIFTTDAPTASGAQTCQLGNQVTSVAAGTPVYANYFYKSPLTGEVVTLTIIKDGSVLDTNTLPSEQANGLNCVESAANLSDLAPGGYEFKLTTSKGETVSDGTLTVK